MQKYHRHLIGVPMCFLAFAAQATVRVDDSKPATLARTVKVGDTLRYKGNIAISVGGTDVTVEQNRKHTVKEVKENGDVVIEVGDEGGKVNIGGTDMDTPAGSPATVTTDKVGKIIAYKAPAEENQYLSPATLHLLQIVDRIIFPDKPVKPGDSWTAEIDNPTVKGKKVTIKTTYTGTDKVEDVAAWKVKQTVDADTDAGKFSAEVTAVIESANGQLISAEQTLKGVPGIMGPVDWKSKLQRVKAAPDKK